MLDEKAPDGLQPGSLPSKPSTGAPPADAEAGSKAKGPVAAPTPAAQQAHLRALMRGARELAVTASLSHPNIVQVGENSIHASARFLAGALCVIGSHTVCLGPTRHRASIRCLLPLP